MKTLLEDKIEQIIEGSLNQIGYDVVRVKMMGSENKTLQIMIDQRDRSDITIDDCEKASKLISALLDVDDPISDAYNLEVSSPGLDRPLVKLEHFKRFIGSEAKINLDRPMEGSTRKRYNGKIVAVEGKLIKISTPETEENVVIDYDLINSAKLVISEESFSKNNKKKK